MHSKQSLQTKSKEKKKTHLEIESGPKSSTVPSPKSLGGLQTLKGFLGENFLSTKNVTPTPLSLYRARHEQAH